VGYALYTTHERPFFFNQSISTGKNFFRFEVYSRNRSNRRKDKVGVNVVLLVVVAVLALDTVATEPTP